MLEAGTCGRHYAATGVALAIGLFVGAFASTAFQYDLRETLHWVKQGFRVLLVSMLKDGSFIMYPYACACMHGSSRVHT